MDDRTNREGSVPNQPEIAPLGCGYSLLALLQPVVLIANTALLVVLITRLPILWSNRTPPSKVPAEASKPTGATRDKQVDDLRTELARVREYAEQLDKRFQETNRLLEKTQNNRFEIAGLLHEWSMELHEWSMEFVDKVTTAVNRPDRQREKPKGRGSKKKQGKTKPDTKPTSKGKGRSKELRTIPQKRRNDPRLQ